jgi:membrane-associated protease RseP (regulator of RpoE activity)
VVDGDQLRATSDSSGEIVIYKISGTSDQDTPLILDSNFDVTPNVNQPAGPVRAASEVGGIITNAPAVLINTIRGKSSIVTLALTAPWGETTTDWLARLLMSFGMLSLIIGLFNLTPIPPFDGGGALMNIITGLAERRGKQAAEAVGKASSKLVWVGYGFMAFCLIWPFI